MYMCIIPVRCCASTREIEFITEPCIKCNLTAMIISILEYGEDARLGSITRTHTREERTGWKRGERLSRIFDADDALLNI